MFERLFKYPIELYREGELGLSSRLPVEVRLLLLACAAALAWYLYRRARGSLPPRTRNLLTVLRGAALLALLLMVLGPVIRLPRMKGGETYVALLLDASGSMSVEDAARGGSRFDAARLALLGSDGKGEGLVPALKDRCGLRVFSFAEGARRTTDLTALKAEGEKTNLFRALRDVDQELRGVPLAAVVAFTDGGHNTPGVPQDMARAFKSRGVKLLTVGYGRPNPPKDYEVVQVEVPRTVRRNTSVDAFTTVRCTGFSEPFTAYLRNGEAILSTMEVRPEAGKDMYRVRFRFYPDQAGAMKYNVFIKPGEGERLTENNLKEFLVDVKEERLPVLYVEGSPRAEFRFIRRALFRDPDFRIVSILRTGHGRYYVQGADDMPELQQGYPKTKEQLFKFEAVIFGDIEVAFFTKEQLEMTEAFVKERGGGFAMLGGVNAFNLGGYLKTPIETLLPVHMEGPEASYSFDRFKMQVPDAALAHPILHQDDEVEQNKKIWRNVPELQGHNRFKGAKTGAQVLALDPLGKYPILAVQNYGRGRTAAFATGGSWYWRMSVTTDVEIQEKFWRQLVRWLAVGSKEKVAVSLDRDIYSKGEQAFIRATVLGPSLEAINDATVRATVTDPFGNVEDLEMQWVLTQDGVYQGKYETREHGDHRVTVHVEIPSLKPIDVGTSFAVTRPFLEFNQAGQKEGLLREMAELTGGRYYTEEEAGALAGDVKKLLEQGLRSGTYIEEKDLWDAPILFVLLLALLGAEWSLRRHSGLA